MNELQAAIDETASLIELGENRALAVDGPVGHFRAELDDKEWRRLWLALSKVRAALAAPSTPEPSGLDSAYLHEVKARIVAYHDWRVARQHGWTGTIGIEHMDVAQTDRDRLFREVIRLRAAPSTETALDLLDLLGRISATHGQLVPPSGAYVLLRDIYGAYGAREAYDEIARLAESQP